MCSVLSIPRRIMLGLTPHLGPYWCRHPRHVRSAGHRSSIHQPVQRDFLSAAGIRCPGLHFQLDIALPWRLDAVHHLVPRRRCWQTPAPHHWRHYYEPLPSRCGFHSIYSQPDAVRPRGHGCLLHHGWSFILHDVGPHLVRHTSPLLRQPRASTR